MPKTNVIRGRIEQHGQGVGLPDRDQLETRAREIAITNGRRPEDRTEGDLAQAREELHATQNGPAETFDASETTPFPDAAVGESWGHRAPSRLSSDEQTLPEDLVAEGIEEATHEQLVEGNKLSRRRDEQFDDQLPSAEP